MTRLQRFRTYMARMNPIADPAQAIRDGLFIPSPGRCTAEMIVNSVEPDPSSTHLIVGGIGSGKTSELLVAADKLRASLGAVGDHTEYVDVSKQHDLSAVRISGVLLALAGESLTGGIERETASADVAGAIDVLERYARRGFPKWIPEDSTEIEEPVEAGRHSLEPGVLVPPVRSDKILNRVLQSLQTLRVVYPGSGRNAVLLFDSLDRLQSADRFRAAVDTDLRLLKGLGIGIVIVGPARFMSGADRSVLDLFDKVHFRLAVNPLEEDGATFLSKVVRRRAEPDMLSDECVDALVRASGGTLRDLITLARRSGEEAYAAGRNRVELEDVNTAVDAFGRSLAVGLDEDERRTLIALHVGKEFSTWGELELSLIETRRILLYDDNVWRVNPTLIPFLKPGTNQ